MTTLISEWQENIVQSILNINQCQDYLTQNGGRSKNIYSRFVNKPYGHGNLLCMPYNFIYNKHLTILWV